MSSSFLRPWLWRPVEAGLGRSVAEDDNGPGQSAALVVAGGRAEPVVARPVEVEAGPSARMVHQPDEFPVAIARQESTMGVPVVIDELEIDVTSVRHNQNRGVPSEFIGVDADRGLHAAIRSLCG